MRAYPRKCQIGINLRPQRSGLSKIPRLLEDDVEIGLAIKYTIALVPRLFLQEVEPGHKKAQMQKVSNPMEKAGYDGCEQPLHPKAQRS